MRLVACASAAGARACSHVAGATAGSAIDWRPRGVPQYSHPSAAGYTIELVVVVSFVALLLASAVIAFVCAMLCAALFSILCVCVSIFPVLLTCLRIVVDEQRTAANKTIWTIHCNSDLLRQAKARRGCTCSISPTFMLCLTRICLLFFFVFLYLFVSL